MMHAETVTYCDSLIQHSPIIEQHSFYYSFYLINIISGLDLTQLGSANNFTTRSATAPLCASVVQ